MNDHLYALDDHSPLGFQLDGVPLMTFLLAVLQSTAFVVLQHPVFTAKVSRAEAAVSNYTLRLIFAVFEGAADFLRRHAAPDRKAQIEGGVREDVQRGEGQIGRAGRQMTTCKSEAEVGCRDGGSKGEQVAKC